MKLKMFPMMVAVGAALCVTSPARADVTVTMHTSMDSPMMDQAMASMSAEQKKMMSNMMDSKLYLSGKHYRMDSSMVSMIMDAGTKQMTMISPMNHTYCVIPVNKDAMKKLMSKSGVNMPTDGSNFKVVDTGKSTQVQGHKCRHYILTMSMKMPTVGTMTMRSDILAAQDMPGLDSSVFQALNMQLGVSGNQVKGVPLETVTKITGGMTGDATVKQEATQVSTDKIPASTFKVPAGYEKTSQADFFKMPKMPTMAP
jgi:hypothetical protein